LDPHEIVVHLLLSLVDQFFFRILLDVNQLNLLLELNVGLAGRYVEALGWRAEGFTNALNLQEHVLVKRGG